MNMYKIANNKNGEKIIKMGRFYSSILKETLEHEMEEELGFCVMAYTDPFLPTLIFFSKEKNEIRGISNLDKSDVVYINIYQKKGSEKWIMKISPVVKGGE